MDWPECTQQITHLCVVLTGEGSATVGTPPTIGVHNDLKGGQRYKQFQPFCGRSQQIPVMFYRKSPKGILLKMHQIAIVKYRSL